MKDYILLMHDDGRQGAETDAQWEAYFDALHARGAFQGGSAIGNGVSMRKEGVPRPPCLHLTGYIRVTAADLESARELVVGNPVYEAGGTVEVRDLPED
ncbi:MAG: hypothetical protein KC933_31210 [Myxococcales bacterium]|nr:hypothetical protein [Myxococcales bacterium]MCB9648169.1 hypothetical protein [Deltaproteobacteria bacterium]